MKFTESTLTILALLILLAGTICLSLSLLEVSRGHELSKAYLSGQIDDLTEIKDRVHRSSEHFSNSGKLRRAGLKCLALGLASGAFGAIFTIIQLRRRPSSGHAGSDSLWKLKTSESIGFIATLLFLFTLFLGYTNYLRARTEAFDLQPKIQQNITAKTVDAYQTHQFIGFIQTQETAIFVMAISSGLVFFSYLGLWLTTKKNQPVTEAKRDGLPG